MSPQHTVAHVDTEVGFSGGEVQVFLLMEGLAQRGVRNVLFCPPGSRSAERAGSWACTSDDFIGIRAYLPSTGGGQGIVGDGRSPVWVGEDPDVVEIGCRGAVVAGGEQFVRL